MPLFHALHSLCDQNINGRVFQRKRKRLFVCGRVYRSDATVGRIQHSLHLHCTVVRTTPFWQDMFAMDDVFSFTWHDSMHMRFNENIQEESGFTKSSEVDLRV